MKENKDALKAIQEFADESPTRSDKLEQAKQLTQELYGKEGAEAEHRGKGGAVALAASSKKTRILTITLCCVALLLIVSILLIFFLRDKDNSLMYYDDESVYVEEVTDIEQFKSMNALDFMYFHDGINPQYEAWRLKETDQLMYIEQSTMLFSQMGFDEIYFGICFSNDEFQRFDTFTEFTDEMSIGETTVNYKVVTQARNDIYAKFSVDGVVYYLNVTTSGGAEVLEQYVNLLLA